MTLAIVLCTEDALGHLQQFWIPKEFLGHLQMGLGIGTCLRSFGSSYLCQNLLYEICQLCSFLFTKTCFRAVSVFICKITYFWTLVSSILYQKMFQEICQQFSISKPVLGHLSVVYYIKNGLEHLLVFRYTIPCFRTFVVQLSAHKPIQYIV